MPTEVMPDRTPADDARTVLRWRTPAAWVAQATRELSSLLDDHAHLERKAASNALELLHRCPTESDTALAHHWATVLTNVARDEVEHLAAVTRLLARRGGTLSRMHRNPYASALRAEVRSGRRGELVDRLIVCALIELRSFERFERLADGVPDADLARLYRRLAVSERGHYVVFLDLAKRVAPAVEVEARWEEMLDIEGHIIAAQDPGPRMHSGL